MNLDKPDSNNPYQAPQAAISPASSQHDAAFNPAGRAVDAGRGLAWFSEGLEMFKLAPGIWIVNVVLWAVIYFAIAMVPILGSLATSLMMPILLGGIMLGCKALQDGDELKVEHLFAGFNDKAIPLLIIGALTLAGGFLIVVVCAALGLAIFGTALFTALFSGGMGAEAGGMMAMAGMGMGFVLLVLLAIGLSVPLYMAMWFAPPLVVFHNMQPIEAMKASFFGCLKNIVPFLLYGIVGMVLAIIATLPILLGWLVLMPVLWASVYIGYRDIYLD